MVIQKGFSGKFQKLYKADDPSSLLCFISPQVYGFPFFQHEQTTSTLILKSHDCNHLCHKCEKVTGEELEDRKGGAVLKDVPNIKTALD